MKKKVVVQVFALWLSFLAGMEAHSTEQSSVDLVMSIVDLNTELAPGSSLDISVTQGQNGVLPRIVVKNTGNVSEDFVLKVATQSGANWVLVSTPPGENSYRLHAIWHEYTIVPSTDEYQNNDILTVSSQTSSATQFFNDSDTHPVSGNEGYNVPVGSERNLFVWMEGPAIGIGTLNVTLEVTALQSP